MAKYGEDNTDHSDSQKDCNNGKLYTEKGDIPDIIKESTPHDLRFSKKTVICPECGSEMCESRGKLYCPCGYVQNTQNQDLSDKKKETFIELNILKTHLKPGQTLDLFGYLKSHDGEELKNSKIDIYFAGRFIKSVLSVNNGYFETSFTVSEVGDREIIVIFKNNKEYEMSAAMDTVHITSNEGVSSKSKVDEMINLLEKLSSLYEHGLLTDDEFEEMKKRLMN